MSLTPYPTLRLKLSAPQALKLQFLPAIPGSNAAASAAAAQAAAAQAEAAAGTAVAATANKVDKTGDTMTGFLTLNANPATALQAATKQYVDSVAAGAGVTSVNGISGAVVVTAGANITVTPSGQNVQVAATGLQPLDGDLTSLASATATNQWYYRSAPDTWSPVTVGATMTFVGGVLNTTAGGGNVIASGTPNVGEWARWTSAATIEGVGGAQGSIIYRDATQWTVLAPGTSGQVLTTNGAAANPTWTTVSASGGAPVGAQYITAATDATLTAERVATAGTSITWDFATAGQAIAKRAALTGDVTAAADSNTTTIANGAVTLAKQANVTAPMIRGRTTAGTGSLEDLTPTQTTAMLDVFTSTLKGLAPSSGGGTTNFLRADGTWNAPAGGGGASLTIQDTPPTAVNGTLWWESDSGRLYVGYLDPGGAPAQWVGVQQQPIPQPGQKVLIQTQTVGAAVATVDFVTRIDATYDEYELSFFNVKPVTTDQTLTLQISSDTGATWKTTGYQYGFRYIGVTGAGADVQATTGTAVNLIVSQSTVASLAGASGVVRFWMPSLATDIHSFMFDTMAYNITLGIVRAFGGGGWAVSGGIISGLRFAMTSGNIAQGTFNLYGIKK